MNTTIIHSIEKVNFAKLYETERINFMMSKLDAVST